jgi:hypothetical protein
MPMPKGSMPVARCCVSSSNRQARRTTEAAARCASLPVTPTCDGR